VDISDIAAELDADEVVGVIGEENVLEHLSDEQLRDAIDDEEG